MAFEQTVRTIDGEAGSAVVPYRFVVLAADGQYDHAAAAQGPVDGVSMEDADAVGKVFPIALQDGAVVKVEAGAAVVVGNEVSTDASGRVIPVGATNGDLKHGRALEAAGAAGEIVSIQFAAKGQVNA